MDGAKIITEEQRLVSIYFENVLAHLGNITPYALSKRTYDALGPKLGVSKNVIGKALNPIPGQELISLQSLLRVSRVAPTVALPDGLFPTGDANGFHGGFAEEIVPLKRGEECPRELVPKMPSQSVWRLKTRALELPPYCYLPGDLVMLDQGVKEKAGSVVCAQIYDRKGGAETVFRAYDPPFLTTATLDERAHRKPEVVDGEKTVIMGTVIRMLRIRED